MVRKFIKFSGEEHSVVLHGNWGSPLIGADGSDFGTVYFDIVTGSQGAEVSTRQLST